MGNYKLSDKAQSDIIRIHQYGFRNYGEKQADKYYYKLIERFEQIAEYPYFYPPVDHIHDGYRRSVFGNESIYYRINDGTVEIMAILGMQNLGNIT